jgi:hypothetical protein
MNNFTVTGDTGTPETIADGNTLDIAGGTGIATAVGATDTVTVNLDIEKLATGTPVDTDTLVFKDVDDTNTPKEATIATILALGGGGGTSYDYIEIQDQKAQNTNGGTFTSGAWRTRDLNTLVEDDGDHCSINYLAFTSGSVEPSQGDTISGATSGATATVVSVEVASGSFGGGDAAGNLWIKDQSGTFQSENLDNDTNPQADFATISADSVNDGSVRLTAGGPYIILHMSAQGHRVARHKAQWISTAGDSVTKTGKSAQSGTADVVTAEAWVAGMFTLAADTTFELQHQCGTTGADTGFGIPSNFSGSVEVYSIVGLLKAS